MADSPTPIAVGVYGLGDHARRTILPAIDSSDAVQLAGIATRDQSILDVEAERWQCRAWCSLHDMVNSSDADVIIVATPIAQHFEDGMAVLDAGKDLWCEKALTRTLDEAETLIENSRRMKRALCLSCPPLYHPQFQALKEFVHAGELGQIRSMSATFSFPHTDASNTKYAPSKGGGALLDVGFYPLVVPASLFEEEPDLLGANTVIEDGYAVDTFGAALLHYPETGIHHTATWGYGGDYINEIQIIGEAGTVIASPAVSKPGHLPFHLTLRRQNETKTLPVAKKNQYAAMLWAFADAALSSDTQERFRAQALRYQRLLSRVQSRSRQISYQAQ